MMEFISTLVLAVSLFSSSIALAGSWSSGGGESHSDKYNPWWFQNTEKISWCLETDESTTQVNIDQVKLAVKKAVGFWQKDLEIDPRYLKNTKAQLGTQTFIFKDSCEQAEVDLKIQIGEGTLSSEQKKYFGYRLPAIIAETVRTSYDLQNLRGKGFIYLKGDSLSLNNVWSNHFILYSVLLHELGHVFGLPHLENTIMDEYAPNAWVKLEHRYNLTFKEGIQEGIFGAQQIIGDCIDPENNRFTLKMRNVFFFGREVGNDENCVLLEWDKDSEPLGTLSYNSKEKLAYTRIKVYLTNKNLSIKRLIGSAVSDQRGKFVYLHRAVNFMLNNQQTIIPIKDEFDGTPRYFQPFQKDRISLSMVLKFQRNDGRDFNLLFNNRLGLNEFYLLDGENSVPLFSSQLRQGEWHRVFQN